jgi:hypothetical protein
MEQHNLRGDIGMKNRRASVVVFALLALTGGLLSGGALTAEEGSPALGMAAPAVALVCAPELVPAAAAPLLPAGERPFAASCLGDCLATYNACKISCSGNQLCLGVCMDQYRECRCACGVCD